MLNVGQVRLSTGQLCPAGQGKGLGLSPAGARNKKKTPTKPIFNNPRTSI